MRSEVVTLRRGLSLAMIIAAWLAVVISIVGSWARLSEFAPARHAALLGAAIAILAGTILRARILGLWLIEASLAGLIIVGLLGDPPPVELLVMGTYCTVFFAIFLSSRRWGLVWIAIGVVVMAVVVSKSTVHVDVAGWSFPVGSVAVLQMVVAGTWLWWAWQSIVASAAEHDRLVRSREQDIAEAVATQERTRAWRAAITRTHETILNDLRYVLRAPQIDRDRLKDQLLTTRDVREGAPIAVSSLSGIVDRVCGEFPGTVTLDASDDVDVGSNGDVLESALREILRNVSRYASATSVTITASTAGGNVTIEVVDDGRAPLPDRPPGIGRSVVVGESLAGIGGRIDESPHRTRIALPLAAPRRTRSIAVLRLLVSVVLAGSALGGSLQFLLLLSGSGAAYLLVSMAALCVTVLATVVTVRGRTVSTGLVVAASISAAAVPWLLALLPAPCADNALALTTINLSADALFATLLWVRTRWLWLLVLPTIAGVGALAVGVGSGCVTLTGGILVNSIVLVPIFLLVSWYSTRRAALREQEDDALWRRQIGERAYAEAAVELAAHLQDSVEQAWDLLWSIAEGRPVDRNCRRRLRTLDSAIRAAIQVDPRTAGGLTLAARDLVDEAVAQDRSVHVRALRGSADARPLPPHVMGILETLVLDDADDAAELQPSIHVFTDGVDDYLSLSTSLSAASRAGLPPGASLEIDGITVESELTDQGTEAEVTVLVRRAVPAAALAGAGVE